MLIKIAPPEIVKPQYMSPDVSGSLEPGGNPPLAFPHCRSCGGPVDEFTVDFVTSPYYVSIDVRCHGQTSGLRLPHDEVIGKRDLNRPIWFFAPGGKR